MITEAAIGLLGLVRLGLRHLWRWKLRRGIARLRARRPARLSTQPVAGFQPPKPPWGRPEILRLKPWMPDAGCRRIALALNHLHERRRGMSVGKTYVASVLRSAGEEVMRLRQKLRQRRPRRFAKNLSWGLGWTYVPGNDSRSMAVLGVIDCGTRACLELAPVASRRTVTLLRQLLDLFERYGTPKVLRTDNEPACLS